MANQVTSEFDGYEHSLAQGAGPLISDSILQKKLSHARRAAEWRESTIIDMLTKSLGRPPTADDYGRILLQEFRMAGITAVVLDGENIGQIQYPIRDSW